MPRACDIDKVEGVQKKEKTNYGKIIKYAAMFYIFMLFSGGGRCSSPQQPVQQPQGVYKTLEEALPSKVRKVDYSKLKIEKGMFSATQVYLEGKLYGKLGDACTLKSEAGEDAGFVHNMGIYDMAGRQTARISDSKVYSLAGVQIGEAVSKDAKLEAIVSEPVAASSQPSAPSKSIFSCSPNKPAAIEPSAQKPKVSYKVSGIVPVVLEGTPSGDVIIKAVIENYNTDYKGT